MLKTNTARPVPLTVRLPHLSLPRLRSLGSRFLNVIVILSMILPHLAVVVEAAAPAI